MFVGASQIEAQEADHCVILLHGLGRTANSMSEIEENLARDGYHVWNESYPSRDKNILTLAEEHVARGVLHCEQRGALKIHFVTHSMGGILVRQYLQNHRMDRLGKIVMLAPPNQGSEISDYLKDFSWFRWIMGPAAEQLGTGTDSRPKTMKPVPGIIGVIAGAISSDPWFSWMFDGPNDGKVAVGSTRLAEMTDFIVVDHGHTFIMYNDYVIEQIVYFLQNGFFSRTLKPA